MSRELSWAPADGTEQRISAAELLRKTINQLSGGAWIKGDFHDGGGGSCILGAQELAMGDCCMNEREWQRVQYMLLRTLKDMHPALTANTIPDLNDDPAVTYEDVIAALEKAVLQLEEQQ